ncbi:MAG: hypothetical protein KF784_13680 [Fimbriimonadaceae bacterium]|nr:hypothetical protein [Fimbriimonadaceae bacterium]
MRKFVGLFLAVAVVVALCGCGAKNKLVGTWTGTMPVVNGLTGDFVQVFNADGTYSNEFTFSPPIGEKMIVRSSGTYAAEGENKLAMTGTSVTLENFPKELDQVVRDNASKELNKKSLRDITWVDDDTITLSVQDQTLTLSRKKE